MNFYDVPKVFELFKKMNHIEDLIAVVNWSEDPMVVTTIYSSRHSDPVVGGTKIALQRSKVVESLQDTRLEIRLELVKHGVWDFEKPAPEVAAAEPTDREPNEL